MFAPTSVAVVGASSDPEKAGAAMVGALAEAPSLYPVNPRGGVLAGLPVSPSLAEVPEPIDLAVLVVPPGAVPPLLEQCAAIGVGAAVVCSGGFAESGSEGAALQERIHQVIARSDMRLLGPNTSGFVNPTAGVRANFMPSVVALRPGPVGVVAQSGGMNLAISFLLHREGIGISLGVGLGNAVDVGVVDMLDYLTKDPATTVIALHLEGVAAGRDLVEALRRATVVKPVVALKVGRANLSAFAQSHTGAMTGNWAVARAALAQAGAVVVDTVSALVDAVAALAFLRLPPVEEPGVAVVTGQAGPGLVIADELAGSGVATPQLSENTVKELRTVLPPLTYQRNPVDTGRPEHTFTEVLEHVGADEAVDLTVVYALQEVGMEAAVHGLTTAKRSSRPTIFISGGVEAGLAPRREALRAAGIPFAASPDRGARGAWALVADARLRERAGRSDRPARAAPRLMLDEPLDEDRAKTVLAELGLRAPQRRVVHSRLEAAEAMAALGVPVVVKLCDVTVPHKSDIGAVHVGVDSERALRSALDRIDAAVGGRSVRYLVESQAPSGQELIVGASRDPGFGPVVVLGLGGVEVELIGGAALALAPLGPGDAEAMIGRLPAVVRRGARGRPPVPEDELADLLTAIGQLMIINPEITEIDVNPVRATADGLLALDALVLTSPNSSN